MERQQRQTPEAKKTEREELRNQRTQRFLDEPARDGSLLVALLSRTSDAGATVRAAEARMKSNIKGIMKPSK